MEKYNEEYLKDKMEDFYAFRDGMMEAGYAEFVVDRDIAIILYSMWKR